MGAIQILIIALLLFALREFALSIFINRRRQTLQHKIRVETTRAHFANLRNDLLNLVISDQLDPDSDTFQMLYLIHTFILRRPDKYRELSKLLADTLLTDKTPISYSSLSRESTDWSPEIVKIIKDTAIGLQLVIYNFSRTLRILTVIAGYIFKYVSSNATNYWQEKIYNNIDKRDPDIRNIRQAKNNLYNLAY